MADAVAEAMAAPKISYGFGESAFAEYSITLNGDYVSHITAPPISSEFIVEASKFEIVHPDDMPICKYIVDGDLDDKRIVVNPNWPEIDMAECFGG